MTPVIRTLTLAAGLLIAPAWLATPVAQHDHEQHATAPADKTQDSSMMKMGCMQSGKMQEMAHKKNANTERIDALMTKVRSSTGDAKVAAMADVIAVLLEERAAMGQACGKK